jgi:hypothetical protein
MGLIANVPISLLASLDGGGKARRSVLPQISRPEAEQFVPTQRVTLSSPGAPASVRRGEHVATMMANVSTYGAALNR